MDGEWSSSGSRLHSRKYSCIKVITQKISKPRSIQAKRFYTTGILCAICTCNFLSPSTRDWCHLPIAVKNIKRLFGMHSLSIHSRDRWAQAQRARDILALPVSEHCPYLTITSAILYEWSSIPDPGLYPGRTPRQNRKTPGLKKYM